MTDLEHAHFAGLVEGLDLAQEIAKKHLLLSHIFETKDHAVVLKRIQDEIALALANRMESP